MQNGPKIHCQVQSGRARVARGATRQDRGYSRHPDFRVYGLIMPMDGPSVRVVERIRRPSAGKWDTERPDECLCSYSHCVELSANSSTGPYSYSRLDGWCVRGWPWPLQFLETALGAMGLRLQ
ncbi:hypothetical protein J3F84DRAFT_185625 [Trichoderma pleuroticola]